MDDIPGLKFHRKQPPGLRSDADAFNEPNPLHGVVGQRNGAFIRLYRGVLVVCTTSEVQGEIADYLANLAEQE